MAPAVPFALLGVVQLASVVVWVGMAATACLPRVRRRTTPLVVAGALAMAVADTLTAVQLTSDSSNHLGELRDVALALLALGFAGLSAPPSARSRAMAAPTMAAPAIVAPLGARPGVSIVGAVLGVTAAGAAWLGGRQVRVGRTVSSTTAIGLLLTALASAMAGPARTSTNAALVLLSARGAATIALATAMVLVARDNLFGKLLGSIVAGVVAMAVGAVAVVGIGVAGEVQHDQSQRLMTAAQTQQRALQAVGSRAALLAQVVAQCPGQRTRCVAALKDFAEDASYFAVIDSPGRPAKAVPGLPAVDKAELVELAGSSIVAGALAPTATAQTAALGPLLLGPPSRLVVVAAVPGRPQTAAGAQGRPTFAAIYGIELGHSYLNSLKAATGYDVSIVAGNRLLSTSLDVPASRQVLAEAISRHVGAAGPTLSTVVAAQGEAPTVAFVPIDEAGNDNVRVATLAVSQPASIALATQRSILRRLVLTALVVLVVIALGALLLAQRIVEPVHELTVAARRVQAGDLDAVVTSDRGDEVGSLARAFDAMTTSLRGLTGDLRDAARLEAGLRARLEAIVRAMTDGLLTTRGNGLIAGANPKALELLGCESGDVVGRPLADAIDLRGPDGSPVDLHTWPPTSDAVLRTLSGDDVSVRFAIAPLTDQPGEVLVIYDRTRDREIERMKTEFLSNISHELRTPLTPIRGYAELLARRPDLPPDQVQQFVAEILAGATRMNRAVELLVDVASLEADRIVSVRRHVNVATYADERLAQWRDRYPSRAADLRRRLAAGLPAIDIDPVWLSKALDELVDNAVKYTAVGRAITVGAAMTDDGLVRISVRDTGEGFDTARLGELLGDFSQADASETRQVGGLGLGLGFVSRVTEQLGVRLHVESTPGHGAEFGIDVAVALPEDPTAPPRQTPGQRQAKKMKTRR